MQSMNRRPASSTVIDRDLRIAFEKARDELARKIFPPAFVLAMEDAGVKPADMLRARDAVNQVAACANEARMMIEYGTLDEAVEFLEETAEEAAALAKRLSQMMATVDEPKA